MELSSIFQYSCYNGGFSEDVCVIQFVLFPPHQCVQMKDAVNDESIEGDLYKESRGELQIATEIWIEPQCGAAYANNGKLQFLHGLTYNEFPKKVSEVSFLKVYLSIVIKRYLGTCNQGIQFIIQKLRVKKYKIKKLFINLLGP